MDKHVLAMNYRCLNLQKIKILCFFAYILKLPTIYNPPPMGWHFHSLEEYSHIAHSTKLLLLWNVGAWKLYDFNSSLDVVVTNIQKNLQTYKSKNEVTRSLMVKQDIHNFDYNFTYYSYTTLHFMTQSIIHHRICQRSHFAFLHNFYYCE